MSLLTPEYIQSGQGRYAVENAKEFPVIGAVAFLKQIPTFEKEKVYSAVIPVVGEDCLPDDTGAIRLFKGVIADLGFTPLFLPGCNTCAEHVVNPQHHFVSVVDAANFYLLQELIPG